MSTPLTQQEKATIYWAGYGPTSPYTLEYWLTHKDAFKECIEVLPKDIDEDKPKE